MLIKHSGKHKAAIGLNIAGGGQVMIKPNHEVRVDLLDPFDPVVVGMFATELLEGDLKAAQEATGDKRSEQQREADRASSAVAASSEITQRHQRAPTFDNAVGDDGGRNEALQQRERALAEREKAVSEREGKVEEQAQTAGDGLGWGAKA